MFRALYISQNIAAIINYLTITSYLFLIYYIILS